MRQLLIKCLKRLVLSAAADDDIGFGKHALKTDKSGKFWGNEGAGGVFFAKDTGKYLLNFRSSHVNEPHTWGVWGGAIDGKETPDEAIRREIREETGYTGSFTAKKVFTYTNGDFKYHNYIIEVPKEFTPELDWESDDFGWFSLDKFPVPLHIGLKALVPYLQKLSK